MSRTFLPLRARSVAREMLVVVLPMPPFWDATEITIVQIDQKPDPGILIKFSLLLL